MPEDDLEIYRNIQLGIGDGYIPWLENMTAEDRFIMRSQSQPDIKGMDWKEVTPRVWIGKFDFEGLEEDQRELSNSGEFGKINYP